MRSRLEKLKKQSKQTSRREGDGSGSRCLGLCILSNIDEPMESSLCVFSPPEDPPNFRFPARPLFLTVTVAVWPASMYTISADVQRPGR